MAKRIPFDNIPFVPSLIAEVVSDEVYTGQEWSVQVREGRVASLVEAIRRKLTLQQKRHFGELCNIRCEAAYNVKAEWFEKLLKDKGNNGRDGLYNVIRHWLSAYCMDPVGFEKKMEVK